MLTIKDKEAALQEASFTLRGVELTLKSRKRLGSLGINRVLVLSKNGWKWMEKKVSKGGQNQFSWGDTVFKGIREKDAAVVGES